MKDKNRYAIMEKYLTFAIFIATAFFLLFLFSSGYAIIWLKVICATISLLIPACSAIYLFLVKEYRKRRSRWMMAASAALIICTLFSLILNFPSPAP